MDDSRETPDRRGYETRGVAVPAGFQGRGPCELTLSTVRKQLVKRYGEGWEVDTVYPGTICNTSTSTEMEEGHMVIFKRRRQLRDE